MKLCRAAWLPAAAASLAACADAGPTGSNSDRNEVAEAESASNDTGVTEGAWQSTAGDGADSVEFRAPDGELLFNVGCDVRRGLLFERHGFVPRADLGMMQLRTGGAVRRLAASGADDPPHVQARASYNDRLIPALLRFQQPLEVRIEGLATLRLPPSQAVRELAKSCQRADRPAAAATSAEAE